MHPITSPVVLCALQWKFSDSASEAKVPARSNSLDNTKQTTFGDELKVLREKVNLSQREAEAATGISSAYLSQLENNKVKKPSPFILHKLASLYGVDYELIMRYAGYVRSHPEANAPKTLVGAALLTEGQLSAEEETELASYLQYLRSRKKAAA